MAVDRLAWADPEQEGVTIPYANAAPRYSSFQCTALVALRMLIGWHFLYEGIAKLLNPYWTAAGYLQAAQGPFSGWFLSLAAEPSRLAVVDALNKWGLVLLGLGLITGAFTRLSTFLGVVLLFLYYIANPPLLGIESTVPTEGSYLLVNKVLIEMAALGVLLAFPTGHIVGIDRLKIWQRGTKNAGRVRK